MSLSRRLRIAVVVPGFPRTRDEPGLAAVADLVERVAAKCDVRVVALRHPTPAARYAMAGTIVEALGHGRSAGARGRARVLRTGVMSILRAHRRQPFDLVHAMWADEPGAVAVIAARLMDRPAVVSVMGGELVALPDIGYGTALGRGGRWTVATSLRLASAVTAGSGYVREQLLAARSEARVHLAPLGVDTTTFSPGPAYPPASRTILFVGSLEPVKDPALALRVFSRLAEERDDLRLVVAGDGALRGQLPTPAEVKFLGQVSRGDMPSLYRSATVLCVSSRHESQSMAAVEAAACGVPVVGFGVGVVPEIARAGGGVAVTPGDEDGLAQALARVVDDPALAGRMGKAARAAAVANFDIHITSARVLDLYRTLVQ